MRDVKARESLSFECRQQVRQLLRGLTAHLEVDQAVLAVKAVSRGFALVHRRGSRCLDVGPDEPEE
jgi:hypothetical protein